MARLATFPDRHQIKKLDATDTDVVVADLLRRVRDLEAVVDILDRRQRPYGDGSRDLSWRRGLR